MATPTATATGTPSNTPTQTATATSTASPSSTARRSQRRGVPLSDNSQPDTAEPTKTTGEVVKDSGIEVSSTYGLGSGIQFRRLDARGVGNREVLEAGLIDAVDVWGYAEQGYEICFPAEGKLIFLDAAGSPRSPTPLVAQRKAGMTCTAVDRPGIVALVSAQPEASVGIADQVRTLSDCVVTTSYILNFRDAPGGRQVLGLIPYRVTLVAEARTADWFRVRYLSVGGWISAGHVQTVGACS